jgi:hypothetical protein
MVKLSDYENRIIDGIEGRLKQVAMQNIVRYAEILDAQSLCEVTKATVFCGAHHYLDVCKSEDFDVVFSRMNMASKPFSGLPSVAEPPDGAITSAKTEPGPISSRWRHP